MKGPSVSIIIPIYNAEEYLVETLESIKKQTYTDFEVICVNDGSKDSSKNIIQQYVDSDEKHRFKLVDKQNEGAWKARLDGVINSTGDYITFVDADDTINEFFVEKLYNEITKSKAEMCVCGFYRIDSKSGKILSKEMKFENRIIEKNVNFEDVISVNTSLWNKMFKAEVLKKMPHIESIPKALDDVIFIALNHLNINKISFVNDYLYNYYVREGSLISSTSVDDVEVAQSAMKEIKDVYIKNNASDSMMEILSAEAFLHLGISQMLRVSNSAGYKNCYKKNYKYLNENFSSWRKTKYLGLIYSLKHGSYNLKLAIVNKVYVLHLFRAFIAFYKFLTNITKKDIKW